MKWVKVLLVDPGNAQAVRVQHKMRAGELNVTGGADTPWRATRTLTTPTATPTSPSK